MIYSLLVALYQTPGRAPGQPPCSVWTRRAGRSPTDAGRERVPGLARKRRRAAGACMDIMMDRDGAAKSRREIRAAGYPSPPV